MNLVDTSYRQEFAKLEKQKSALLTWTIVFRVGTMGTVLAMLKL